MVEQINHLFDDRHPPALNYTQIPDGRLYFGHRFFVIICLQERTPEIQNYVIRDPSSFLMFTKKDS